MYMPFQMQFEAGMEATSTLAFLVFVKKFVEQTTSAIFQQIAVKPCILHAIDPHFFDGL